jgi:hypothetical protein
MAIMYAIRNAQCAMRAPWGPAGTKRASLVQPGLAVSVARRSGPLCLRYLPGGGS